MGQKLFTWIGTLCLVAGFLFVFAMAVHEEMEAQEVEPDFASPFKWKIVEDNLKPHEWFRFDYKDGRTVQVRQTAVLVVSWQPLEWAQAEGLNEPYIELGLGQRTQRVYIPDEATGKELYSEIFDSELGEVWDVD